MWALRDPFLQEVLRQGSSAMTARRLKAHMVPLDEEDEEYALRKACFRAVERLR